MASADTKDSLDVLQDMFNDALIQTGKALRDSRNGAGNAASAQPSSFKLPDTIQNFHSALDKIENDIIRAKSVMQRDLSRLQNNTGLSISVPPQPVQAQSKEPMVIDLDSSPVKEENDVPATSKAPEQQPVAPFPDMGTDVSSAPKAEGAAPNVQPSQAPKQLDVKAESPAMASASVPTPATSSAIEQPSTGTKAPGDASGGTAAEAPMHFTNMQFSLAPTENGAQGDGGAQDQGFDLSSFGSTDMGNGGISLDSLLPQNSTQQTQANDNQSASGAATSSGQDAGTSGFDPLNMDSMDFSAADGTDFDFSMDDDNSFNALMSSHEHEQNFDNTMEHGQFDTDFFGLDKTDGS